MGHKRNGSGEGLNSSMLHRNESMMDSSSLNLTSKGGEGGSGLLLTPLRHTKSRGSLLDPTNSISSGSKVRRPNTSGSLVFSKNEPGPESVFNLEMAGLHIPDDPPRKLTKFEKRVKKQQRMRERTNHMIELQTLNNRVKQLEIILLEERKARQRSQNQTKPLRHKRKKKRG